MSAYRRRQPPGAQPIRQLDYSREERRRQVANLYEINEQILGCVDGETGEIVDIDRLQELQLTFDEKVEGIACWIKNLLSDAAAIKAEKDALEKRERAYKNKAESLKQYLYNALGGAKFKSPKAAISYRRSESVDVIDPMALPEEFLKYAEPTVDKTKVKAAIKEGLQLPGVCLVEKQNIQIR